MPAAAPSFSSARTTAGNCDVLSLPRRDHNRTRCSSLPGSTSAIVLMPSYFGSYTSDGLTSGGSVSVASIGLSASDVVRQRGSAAGVRTVSFGGERRGDIEGTDAAGYSEIGNREDWVGRSNWPQCPGGS